LIGLPGTNAPAYMKEVPVIDKEKWFYATANVIKLFFFTNTPGK
jgi:hypothetical protein